VYSLSGVLVFIRMSGIADAMHAGLTCIDKQHQAKLCSTTTRNASMFAAYVLVGIWGLVICRHFSDGDFSAVLTASSITQFLGFVLLNIKVRWAQAAAGLSSKTLELYFLFFCVRLGSTCFKNGYLPIDKSGDWAYQMGDILSVPLVLRLLYSMHKHYGHTYQAQHDTLQAYKAIPICAFLAYFVKGDLNNSPFFDWLWMFSLLLDTIAMLPQLWMMTKIGGLVDGMTSHYVVCLIASRGFAFLFWWHGYVELQIKGEAFNKAGYTVITAHILQLVVCADFMYYYAKGMLSRDRKVMLPYIDV